MQKIFILEISNIVPKEEILSFGTINEGVFKNSKIDIQFHQTDNIHSKYSLYIVDNAPQKCLEIGIRLKCLFDKYKIPMTQGNYSFS